MKGHLKLWIIFSLDVIAIIAASSAVTGYLALTLLRPVFSEHNRPALLLSIIGLILIGVMVSTFLTIWISRRLLRPIEHLIESMRLVAEGDFSVRLPESHQDTPIDNMNRNFNKMVKELNSIEMLQSDFIQNVSHEFKTPLAAIDGYASLLEDAPLEEEYHSYALNISKSTRQLSTLTGNILKLSRLEQQAIVTEKEYYFLDEQLRKAILSLEPLWDKKKLNIDLELPAVEYYGNPGLIYQVWTNLFSNAIKFTPSQGSILVEMNEDSQGIKVAIHDTGSGMDDDVIRHIFDKFYQGEHSRHVEGNGLGLALVKKILDLCGGTIEVSSRPDCGSTFSVWLPKPIKTDKDRTCSL